ncbi:MAG: SDR family oxidoreductase [Pseudomonadota bacterium]
MTSSDNRRCALVTGGARGIGRAIARDLMRDHDVAFTFMASQPGEDLNGCLAIQADLTEAEAQIRVVDAVIASFGRIDVLVNNAGAIEMSPIDDFDEESYRRNTDLNLMVPHALLSVVLPHMVPGSSVINISSVNAQLPPKGAVMYGASKAALNLWTKGVAKELGPRGIRVNAVAPGPVNIPEAPRDADLTQQFLDMTALDRLATPEDIAAAVRFLAGAAAQSITGEILTVSGGYRL